MRIDHLVQKRIALRKMPGLMIFPDRAYANGKKVDLDKFKKQYADEIEAANRSGQVRCIDASNAQGEPPKEL